MKKIKLTQGQFALVDDWNYDWLNQFKWFAVKGKYTYYAVRAIRINGKRKTIWMHREIMKTPEGMEVDHKDHNPLNCQEYNMRNCTHQQNLCNRQKYKGCSSKFIGVTWAKHANKWKVAIQFNRKQIHLGLFVSETEAAKAYNKAGKELFKEFVVPNLIKTVAI